MLTLPAGRLVTELLLLLAADTSALLMSQTTACAVTPLAAGTRDSVHSWKNFIAMSATVPDWATMRGAPCGLRRQLCCSRFRLDSSSDRSAGLLLVSVACCSRALRSSCRFALLLHCGIPLSNSRLRAKITAAVIFWPVLSSCGAVDASQSWRTAASRETMQTAGLLKMGRAGGRCCDGSASGTSQTAGSNRIHTPGQLYMAIAAAW